MSPIEEANKSLGRIELILKSIDYQLTKLTSLITTQEDRDKTTSPSEVFPSMPDMITIKEASRRTGLSYDYLRKECIKGNINYLQVGNGKRLINYNRLIEQIESTHGSIKKKVDEQED